MIVLNERKIRLSAFRCTNESDTETWGVLVERVDDGGIYIRLLCDKKDDLMAARGLKELLGIN